MGSRVQISENVSPDFDDQFLDEMKGMHYRRPRRTGRDTCGRQIRHSGCFKLKGPTWSRPIAHVQPSLLVLLVPHLPVRVGWQGCSMGEGGMADGQYWQTTFSEQGEQAAK